MKIHEKYLEALKTFSDYVTVSEWATRFGEIYPDELDRANKQAENQKNDTTGLREIAARLSSRIASGGFAQKILIDDSERPKKVKYISKDELNAYEQNEINEDIEPLKRQDIISNAMNELEVYELYRITEFENIQKAFKQFFGIDFEIDHAQALLNDEVQGKHHADNFQLLLKHHNGKKNKNSWKRFTFQEQADYIKQTVVLQSLVASKFDIRIDSKLLTSLLTRLEKVY